MSLSEKEQRIFNEIERSLRGAEPGLDPDDRSSKSVGLSKYRFPIISLIIGFCVMIGFFSTFMPISILGIVIMLCSIFLLDKQIR